MIFNFGRLKFSFRPLTQKEGKRGSEEEERKGERVEQKKRGKGKWRKGGGVVLRQDENFISKNLLDSCQLAGPPP